MRFIFWAESEREPYRYMRYRYFYSISLDQLQSILTNEGFHVEKHEAPKVGGVGWRGEWNRDHVTVKADTLEAFLNPYEANLFQRVAAPFTPLDLRLREVILDIYPRTRSTVVPIYFSREPEFEISR